MLVHTTWYSLAEAMQYHDLALSARALSGEFSPPSLQCLQTIQTCESAARAVHHLTVAGVTSGRDRVILREALASTTDLLSLDLRENALQDDSLLPGDLVFSPSGRFLPNLTALCTNDARLVSSLAAGRPVYSVAILQRLEMQNYTSIVNSLQYSTSRISQLRLHLNIDNMASSTGIIQSLAEMFPGLAVLALQFELPDNIPRRPVAWSDVADAIGEMSSSLCHLYSLDVLSLVWVPEPLTQGGNPEYERKTRELRDILAFNVPHLRHIEIRWHGWTKTRGAWSPVERHDLLRNPAVWYYTRTRRKCAFSRNAIN